MSGLMTGALEIGVGCAKAFDADVEEDGVGSEIWISRARRSKARQFWSLTPERGLVLASSERFG